MEVYTPNNGQFETDLRMFDANELLTNEEFIHLKWINYQPALCTQ